MSLKSTLRNSSYLSRSLMVGAVVIGLSGIPALRVYALDDGALPSGGVVVGGEAQLDYAVPDELHIYQNSQRTVIDWNSFNIGQNALTQFHQPNQNAIAINRVLGGQDPTQILGTLKANGMVMVLDPNGVFFGPHSRMDVGSIIASAGDIDAAAFMVGGNTIDITTINPHGFVVNQGTITAADAGLVGFIAPTLVNSGVINAKLGTVDLAAGTRATLDLYGDGLMEVAVDQDTLSQTIINNGVISAQGGTVALRAAAAKNVVDNVIYNKGIVAADSFGADRTGTIVLYAHGANKSEKQGTSSVINDGYLSASGRHSGESGGAVAVLGDHVALTHNALIDASGDVGGGDIKVGGDYLGTGSTPTALTTYVDKNALILNDAVTDGNGGRTIVWSDDTTEYHGSVYARGGAQGGNGGFLETSGKINLLADGVADLSAARGAKGTYLLDPANITIYGNVDPTFVSTDNTINLASNLALWLDASDAASLTIAYDQVHLGAAATASGAIGTNTITTNNNYSALLVPGARIRIGPDIVTTGDSVVSDVYTIASIVGTTITTVEALTATYTNGGIRTAVVNQWNDKSDDNSHATSTGTYRPLWVSTSSEYNDLGTLQFYNAKKSHLNLTPDLNNTAGAYNSVFFTSNWGGGASQMPLGFVNYDLWYSTTNSYGFNGGASLVYGIDPTPLLSNSTHQMSAYFYNGLIESGARLYVDSEAQTLAHLGGSNSSKILTDSMRISSWVTDLNYTFGGTIGDVIVYDTDITDISRNLIEQYQSAKWGTALNPLPGAGTEAAEAMDAANGFGAFTTRYLERLSASADIVLQAGTSITLDLQGDTLTLADDRNISLSTTNGDITTASIGTITTNRTGAGGNISFTAGGGGNIAFNHAFGLNVQNDGVVTLTAGGTVSAGGDLTVTGGDLNIDAANITGTYTGVDGMLDSNAGTINATTSFETLDIAGAGATLLPGYIGAAGAASQAMANQITVGGVKGPGTGLYSFAGFKIGYVAPSAVSITPPSVLHQSSFAGATAKGLKYTDDPSRLLIDDTDSATGQEGCLVQYEDGTCLIVR